MVVVIENKPKQIAAILAKDGFNMTVRKSVSPLLPFVMMRWPTRVVLNDFFLWELQVVRSTKAKNERLSILKFSRSG